MTPLVRTDAARATAARRGPRPGEPVGWGIVGCGWVARDHVLPGLLATPSAWLVGACDRDPVAATRLAARAGATASENLEALLDLPGLHAVYVATPNHVHAAAVAAAAGRGLPVLCEKPLAHDVRGATALVEACERTGVLAGAAFHPAHRQIAELVTAGELGTVTAVRIVYGCWLPRNWSPDGNPHDNWRIDPVRAGGEALIDLAPHGIDLVGALLGDDLATLTVFTHARPRARLSRR